MVTTGVNGEFVCTRTYLSEEPLAHSEFTGPGPSVEHQVQVGDPSKQVSCRQVPQQVVDGVMEASVYNDGRYNQDVRQNDEAAHSQPQSHYGIIPFTPVGGDNLVGLVVVIVNCIIRACFIETPCHGGSGHVGSHSPRGQAEAGIKEGRWCVIECEVCGVWI